MRRSALSLLVVTAAVVVAASTAVTLPLGGAESERSEASVTAEEPLLVAAASDLRPAFEKLGAEFEARTGEQVSFSFGSSGQLAQQLVGGAPMDLYASADAGYVDHVLDAGRGKPGTRATYASGRLAVWSPESTWGGWTTLEQLAADPDVETVAIANPEHAPYGAAAREALQSAGVWRDLESRLVLGQSVTDAHRLAATGNADVAVVALSLALASEGQGRWHPVDEERYELLQQDLLVVAEDPERTSLARRFADYLTSGPGRETMRRHGFVDEGGSIPEAGGD